MNKSKFFSRRKYLPALAFLVLAVFTALTFLNIYKLERANVEIRFLQAAADRVAAVQQQFELSIAALDNVGTFFDTRAGVTESEFQRFVDPILNRNPMLTGIGYAPLIRADRRAAFEAETAIIRPGFRITDRQTQGRMVAAAERQSYTPVRYLVPLASNEAAFGFDLSSDANRKRALTEAARFNEVRATAPIILVQETGTTLSFLLGRPLYLKGNFLDTVAEREAALTGYVTAVVRSSSMVDSALAQLQPAGIDFRIYDITETRKPTLLAEHLSRMRGVGDAGQLSENPDWLKSTEFKLAGRLFRVELASVPPAFETRAGPADWGLLLVGLAFSLAVAVLLRTIQASETKQQQSADALRVLSQRLINVQEHERASLAREIHDEIGQAITAVKLNLHALGDARDRDSRRHMLEDSNSILDRILHQVRNITLDLRPPMLDDLGLDATLAWYLNRQVSRTDLELSYAFDPTIGRLPKNLETSAFRFVQEAATNVIRHAEASVIFVSLNKQQETLQIVIEDDGIGLASQTNDKRHANSLRGLRQRVALAGGTLTIKTAPGKGIQLEVKFPLDSNAGIPTVG